MWNSEPFTIIVSTQNISYEIIFPNPPFTNRTGALISQNIESIFSLEGISELGVEQYLSGA